MSLNRRYIASLAVVAVAILAIGLVVKRQLRVEPTAVATLSEAAAMQQLSQEGQVRRLSSYLEERIAAVGTFAEYVPASRASGVRWRAGDTLLTTFADRPVAAIPLTSRDSMRVAPVATSDSLRGQWALLVARTPDGALISASGIVGGRATITCGEGMNVAEYLIGVPLQDEFAGGGVFDLDGRLRGVVARCGNRLAVLPASTILRLLADRPALGPGAVRAFGAVLQPIAPAARAYFATDSGLLVTEVLESSAADRATWQPGDIVVQIDSVPVGEAMPRAMVDSLAPSDTAPVIVLRSGRRISTRLVPGVTTDRGYRAEALGIGVTPRRVAGVPIERVDAGSIAHSAGLRPGDVLIRIDGAAVTTPAAAQRVLDRIAQTRRAAFLVFVRDSVRRGVLIQP